MKIDDEALRFVAEGLKSYRDVSLAKSEFEEQTKGLLRSVIEEFPDQFATLGCVEWKPDVRTFPVQPSIEMERVGKGVRIGIGIQTKAEGIDAYAFAAFSSAPVRDAVRVHLNKAGLGGWQQNYEAPRSYVWQPTSPDHTSEIFAVLRDGLRTLIESLWQVKEFRTEFGLDGPQK